MKRKVINFIRVSLVAMINLIWGFFSAPRFFMALEAIRGTIKGYQMQEPDRGIYIYIGSIELLIYLAINGGLQYVLYRVSKLKLKRYVFSLFILFLIGTIAGYLYFR